ncbi:hypothetical protein [Kordia sp.]|uniref:hypothetical protein n=1 Tax=Kordia sp. TaxID=1965332 RepID=UPI003B5AA97D
MKKNIKKLGIKKINVANLSTESAISIVAGGIKRSRALGGECWYSRHRDCTLAGESNNDVTCEASICYRCYF